MDKLKYIILLILIYIIYRIVYNSCLSTSYLKIIYEGLLYTPSIVNNQPPSVINIQPSVSPSNYQKNVYIPVTGPDTGTTSGQKIQMTITTSTGKKKTVTCVGDCVNCVVTSITNTGCTVSEMS
jgi:hypothetical protein